MPRQPGRREPSGREKAPPAPRPPGRPSAFTQDLGDFICARVATSKDSMATICQHEELPDVVTVFRWLRTRETFRKQYALAKEQQAELLVEEILAIADDGTNDTYVDERGQRRADKDGVMRSRLRVEARKWLVSKLLPRKYGDKADAAAGDGTKAAAAAAAATAAAREVVLPEARRAALMERHKRAMEAGGRS